MTHIPPSNYFERPTVILFADPNDLGISLLENLLANLCKVKIITNQKNLWEQKINHVTRNSFVEIVESSNFKPLEVFDYLIFDSSNLNKNNNEINLSLELLRDKKKKAVLILPFSTPDLFQEESVIKIKEAFARTTENLATIFVGDIYGPRMTFSGQNPIAEIFCNLNYPQKTYTINAEDVLYPSLATDVAKEISKSLLSFGFFGEEISLLPKGVLAKDFLDYVNKFRPITILSSISEKRISPKNLKNVLLNTDFRKGITETLLWLRKNTPPLENKVKQKTPNKISKNILLAARTINQQHPNHFEKFGPNLKNFVLRNKVLFRVCLVILLISLAPFFSLLISGGTAWGGKKEIEKGRFVSARNMFIASSGLASFSAWGFDLLSQTPILGVIFDSGLKLSNVAKMGSDIGIKITEIAFTGRELLGKTMGGENYFLTSYANNLSLNFDTLYKKIGFLQGDLTSPWGLFKTPVQKLLPENDFIKIKDYLLLAKLFSFQVPSLLGEEKAKTYLVLFQNNMELRPTGGFIGSFALLTLEKGRMTNLDVQDVYAADGQLKGHVEPPGPIKNYLGEANWFLRDSNWSPDFPTSAQRAEWFLEKELDRSVDGVIALDLEVAKKLLMVTGPVSLADYNTVVDYKNLYEKTQYEVENNFFPGSYKKSNFLMALAKAILAKIPEALAKNSNTLALAIKTSLDEKHIQTFLHNSQAQKVVSELGYDGAVNIPLCQENCFNNWAGVVDANLGVNKSNLFIKRKIFITSDLLPGSINNRLMVLFENSANPSLGYGGKYKTYLRIILPENSNITESKITSLGKDSFITPEIEQIQGRKEVGYLIEIEPSQKKGITFSWSNPSNLDFNKNGEYRFYLRKQAGTLADPVSILLTPPKALSVKGDFSLTNDAKFVYNTTLARDINPRISW